MDRRRIPPITRTLIFVGLWCACFIVQKDSVVEGFHAAATFAPTTVTKSHLRNLHHTTTPTPTTTISRRHHHHPYHQDDPSSILRSSSSSSRRHSGTTRLYESGSRRSVGGEAEGGADDDGGGLSSSPPQQEEPKVYAQRWIQLGYLSMLALLSDWICFSVAATPSSFAAAYPGHSAASLIDIFLFTNVASCFLVTDIVSKYGLGKAIKGASMLMAVGCFLRSGLPEVGGGAAVALHLVSYPCMVGGTVLVGAAQPFFQCTPPMLSATWFASDERATSTAVALNFNQIGIATAFLVGGAMSSDLPAYFTLITALCLVVTTGTLFQFQNKPPSPPSTSELEKQSRGATTEPPFVESVQTFFATPGFTRPLAAFICSISITNIVGTFIDEVLERGGISNQFSIDLAGAGFEFAILLGGIIIGGYVDRTKKYKDVTSACLLSTIFLILPLGLTDHALGNEPVLLILSLLGLGMAAGPIQPINAELAVDVTYPCDETAVESVQQIGGNLISALLVPVAELASKQDYQLLPSVRSLASDVRGDVVLLMAVAIATYVYFQGFDAPLRRTLADCGDDGSCNAPEGLAAASANGAVLDVTTTTTTSSGGGGSPPVGSGMTPEQKEILDKLR